jgi:cytochrome c-type biogenesis protein CcmH
MTGFVILAGILLALALAFPLLPLLRRRAAPSDVPRRRKALDDALAAGVIDDAEYAAKRALLGEATDATAPAAGHRAARIATIAVAVLLPAAAILLYRVAGEPAALDPQRLTAAVAPAGDGEHGVDMNKAIDGLVAKLAENPENADGWALLGRAYQSTGRFAESRDALKRAYDLGPDNHDMTVEYAQALALAGEGRRIVGEPRALIEKVLAADPDHQRALWLIGISDYQQGNYAAAIAAWNRLLPNLPPDSDIAQSVRTQIDEATRLASGGPASAPASAPAVAAPPMATAAPPATATAATSATTGPRLNVRVSLDPKLAARLDPKATLFVFARAASGPPMPLAIHRATAGELPLSVTLDDSMGMMPSMKLSMFPQVIVGARLSSSGNAMAQSGDLQVLSSPIDVTRSEPLELVIDSVVP